MNTAQMYYLQMQDELDHAQASGLLRQLVPSERDGVYLNINDRRLVNFGCNDYLQLSQDPSVLNILAQAKVLGAGSARVLSGNSPAHEKLECELAQYLKRPAALTFGSGYLVNIATLATLARRHDLVFADRYIHASLIDGILLARAKLQRFKHNDLNSLRQLLQQAQRLRRPEQRFILVTESLFSMDGDLAPLVEMAALAQEFETLLVVDEAHALGVLGPNGAGLLAELGLASDNIVLTASLSKSFGGYGGVLAGSQLLKDYMVNFARQFIFHSSYPIPLAQAASRVVEILTTRGDLGLQLLQRAKRFRRVLKEYNLPVLPGESQIVPLIIPGNEKVLQVRDSLKQKGIFVPAIRAPTVEKGKERLRFSLNLGHSDETLEHVALQLAEVLRANDD